MEAQQIMQKKQADMFQSWFKTQKDQTNAAFDAKHRITMDIPRILHVASREATLGTRLDHTNSEVRLTRGTTNVGKMRFVIHEDKDGAVRIEEVTARGRDEGLALLKIALIMTADLRLDLVTNPGCWGAPGWGTLTGERSNTSEAREALPSST